ncbi:SPFH domain-containing protein, partial [Holdemanella sp.]|uniref:SPFH domain-containing protein n=1 Tax=Holdemanella sp. TaxID=1971762 RepID=UPI003AF0651D
MGLIKAAKNAVGSTLHDQWKEAIRCENMTNDVLMVKKTTPTGVITNKSTIIVAPGQCAVIYDNGRVIDATAEDGFYTFDSSSSPSFFAGQFGAVFKEMWQRFTFNGATAKEQAVFFFNIKEIMDNKFGTPAPIPFQDWSHPIPNQMTNTLTPLRVQIKCFGKFTFSIMDPALFMQKLAGTADIYKKDQVVEQLRSEVIAVFQNVTNELGTSKYKVPVLEMPSQTDEIRQMMDEKVFDEKIRERGIKIDSFAVESVTLDAESEKKIDDYELSSNAYMQQGKMVSAYSEAVKSAAENSGGAMNGFMGIGMMNMNTGNVVGGAVSGPWNNTENSKMDLSKQEEVVEKPVEETKTEEPAVVKEAKEPVSNKWTCDCGSENEGNFCTNCGSPKPRTCKK